MRETPRASATVASVAERCDRGCGICTRTDCTGKAVSVKRRIRPRRNGHDSGGMLPLAPPPAAPPPRFAAPLVVTRSAQATSGPPALAINEQGRRLVAWIAHGRIVVRGRAISARGASVPSLALA